MDSKYQGDIHEALKGGEYENRRPYAPKSEDASVWQTYSDENVRVSDMFRTDAIEYVGLTGHPKAGKAYGLAWSLGHSSGYSDVLSYLFDLAELLKD